MTLLLAFSGIFLGLLSATVTESLGHKLTGHPSSSQRRLYFKYPRIFLPFLRPLFQHLVIHHHKTFQGSFFRQFQNDADKQKVDAWIAGKFSPEFAALIWRERYNLTLEGSLGTVPFALPFCVGPLLIWLALGPVAMLGSLLTAFIPVWMSKYMHPLVHLPDEAAHAHPFIQWLMRTRYMRHVFRNHYLHHVHPETNFNLLLGGDYLVGLHRKASPEEERDLAALEAEFARRACAPGRLPQAQAQAQAAGPEAKTEERRQQLTAAYLALENPTFSQRFQYQLESAALPPEEYIPEDFGMSMHDKVIEFRSWRQRPEFSLEAYEREAGQSEHTVKHRGCEFTTGDLVFCNQSNDSDGIYSTLLEEPINFSHVALFAVLEHAGQRYPAVIEMDLCGVRAIPLKAFLGRPFISYLEHFKPRKALSASEQEMVVKGSLEMVEEDHAFDIYLDASQDYYLNCARTVAEIYRRAGLPVPPARSRYSQRTFANLKTLGIDRSAGECLMMPNDFAYSPLFHLAGVVDNGCFEDVLARALVRGRIQEIWREEILDPRRYPLAYYLNRFVIRGIQRGSLLSPLFLRLVGLQRRHFPAGPEEFLSLAPTSNQLMEKSTQNLREELKQHRQRIQRLGSWEAVSSDPQIRAIVIDSTRFFLSTYVQCKQPLIADISVARESQS